MSARRQGNSTLPTKNYRIAFNKVYQDRKGFIWIATEDGLNKFDGNRFTIYKQNATTQSSLLNNYVKTVFEDSRGRFWVGCLNGVQRYDRTTDSFQTLSIYHHNRKINPQIASNILERKNGEIWIGTYGQGIVTLRRRTLQPGAEGEQREDLLPHRRPQPQHLGKHPSRHLQDEPRRGDVYQLLHLERHTGE